MALVPGSLIKHIRPTVSYSTFSPASDWMALLLQTQASFSVFWIYNIFHVSRTPTVHTAYLAPDTLLHSSALVPEPHLYILLPARLSVVNTACVVYGNVGHLFVVLFGIRPQVEVNDCWVDAACLRVSLLHHLAKAVFDQLHTPNRTTSDLDLSPVSRTEQLACQTPDIKT